MPGTAAAASTTPDRQGRRNQAVHLLLVKAQPHECVGRGRQLLDCPRPLADHRDQLLARVDSAGQHAEQLRCACAGRDPEREQCPVPVRAQSGEQLIELAVRDLPGDPLSHPRPEQSGPLPVEPVHRIVVRVRPAGPGQREGVHQRSRPGLQVKVVERPGHRLAVRDRRGGELRPGRRLARHAVRHRNARTDPGRAITAPVPASRLASDLNPPDEIACLHPRGLIPSHLNGPEKPEPPQERHRIRPLRGRRPPARLQVGQEHRHRRDRLTRRIRQPVRLEWIPCRLHGTHKRHRQPHQAQRPIVFDHDPGR